MFTVSACMIRSSCAFHGKQGLSGLVAEILYTNEEQAHLLPLDMERTGEGVIHWLERRVIPKTAPLWMRF